MMKKTLNVSLVSVLIASICFCGTVSAQSENQSVMHESSIETTSSELSVDEAMEELSSIGEVQVEDGILTVSITLPKDYVEGVTQEQLDASKEDKYESAVLNEDGSVTYKMTKEQHQNMMKSISDEFDKSVQELIDDDENYSIDAVSHNKDFSEFDVTLAGTELGFQDSFSVVLFYMYGGMYGIFSGHQPEHVIVNFLDPDGNIIESANSANMPQ